MSGDLRPPPALDPAEPTSPAADERTRGEPAALRASRKQRLGAALCIVAALLVLTGWAAAGSGTVASTDNAYVRGDITSLAPKVGGYVIAVEVQDNQAVHTGEVLFRIERSVLAALSDSETAINRYASASRTRVERDAARAAAAEAVELARRRYAAGEDDLTAVLQTQASFSAADRLSTQAAAAELTHLTTLYKALGGGWEAVIAPAANM